MSEQTQPPTYIQKLRGEKAQSALPYPKLSDVLISGLGGMLIIALLQLLSSGDPALLKAFIVPFGATAVLVFAAPAAPFSQPRNVIGGHLVAGLVGLLVAMIFKQSSWWVMALANGLAIALMVATKTVHPPAGATVFLPVLASVTPNPFTFLWLLTPVLVGAVLIVVVGVLYNNLWAKRKYPNFWY